MRSKRILALSTILAISTLGVGLASAQRAHRGKRVDRATQHQRSANKSRAHRRDRVVTRHRRDRVVRRPTRFRRPARRYVRAPVHRHVRRRVVRRPIRRSYRPTYVISYNARLTRLINRIMFEADLDNDGYISRWEARRHHRLRGKFGLINRDWDGVLTRHELWLYFG